MDGGLVVEVRGVFVDRGLYRRGLGRNWTCPRICIAKVYWTWWLNEGEESIPVFKKGHLDPGIKER
jgi:hypothetical protein